MKVLRNNDVEVTALHNHMLTEQPRLFYMHFWAKGDATELADTMCQALDETNSEV